MWSTWEEAALLGALFRKDLVAGVLPRPSSPLATKPEVVGLLGAGFVVLAFGPSVPCMVQGDMVRKRSVLLAGVSIEVLTAGSFEPPV